MVGMLTTNAITAYYFYNKVRNPKREVNKVNRTDELMVCTQASVFTNGLSGRQKDVIMADNYDITIVSKRVLDSHLIILCIIC